MTPECLIGCPVAAPQKPVHGEKLPLWKRLGLCEHPPIPCAFRVGDPVIFRNQYGAEFAMFVAGFSDAPDAALRGGFVHLTMRPDDASGSAWWYPHALDEISHAVGGGAA